LRSLDAICETFAPGAVEQGVPAAVHDSIDQDLTPRERRRLLALLRTWLPGYARLPQERREAVLRAWRDSPVPLMRTGFQALRKAALAMAAAGARDIFTLHARMQRYDGGFPPDAFRFGAGRGGLYSFHLMGSARMGRSPETSAADAAGETWEVKNLVVADGSTFPTASGVNPMITIQAIAHLNARKLAARLT
jgi:choline dehydrogenase-like flavoprotein